MTVSATASVCHQHILSESPVSASPAMKLFRPYGIRLNRGILTARGVRPQIPIELSQRGRQRCNRKAKLVFLPYDPAARKREDHRNRSWASPALRQARRRCVTGEPPTRQIRGRFTPLPSAPVLC